MNHPQQQMSWQDEFERLSQINNGYYEQKGMLVGCDQCGGNLDKEAVKAFIQDLLDRKAREIEKLKQYDVSSVITWSEGLIKPDEIDELIEETLNRALDKAISILKEE